MRNKNNHLFPKPSFIIQQPARSHGDSSDDPWWPPKSEPQSLVSSAVPHAVSRSHIIIVRWKKHDIPISTPKKHRLIGEVTILDGSIILIHNPCTNSVLTMEYGLASMGTFELRWFSLWNLKSGGFLWFLPWTNNIFKEVWPELTATIPLASHGECQVWLHPNLGNTTSIGHQYHCSDNSILWYQSDMV